MRTLKTVSPRQSAEFPDADRSRSDWQSGFLELLPAIQTRLRFAFRRLSSEAREEAVQESTCAACRAYARLSILGRAHVATAASLTGYAAAQYRDGRRVGSPLNVNDVCSEHCRLRKGVTVDRLDRRDGDAWREALVEDRTVTPADLAASRIDYPAFLAVLSPKARSVAEALAGGEHPGEVAARFGVSASRVSQLRRDLRAAWLRFHGEADSAVVGVDPAERKSLSRLDTKSPKMWIPEFPSPRRWTFACTCPFELSTTRRMDAWRPKSRSGHRGFFTRQLGCCPAFSRRFREFGVSVARGSQGRKVAPHAAQMRHSHRASRFRC